MTDLDNSFDENDSADFATVVAEFPNGDDHPNEHIPIKKLSTVFDGMVKPDENNMKVYLRVRPFKSKEESTITIESDTTIISHAPESSKRAQYTKTESRHYVRFPSIPLLILSVFYIVFIIIVNSIDFYSRIWRKFSARRYI